MLVRLYLLRNLPFFQRRQWQPTPLLLPGKSHGWRSLVGCNPRGCWESDTTEWVHFHFSLSCTGEGNGNPLQYSCLENPRNGGTWWASVYGVAQSWTRLKWLSNSSCLSSRLMPMMLWPRTIHLVSKLSQNACCGWGAWCYSELWDISFL